MLHTTTTMTHHMSLYFNHDRSPRRGEHTRQTAHQAISFCEQSSAAASPAEG